MKPRYRYLTAEYVDAMGLKLHYGPHGPPWVELDGHRYFYTKHAGVVSYDRETT